MLPREHGEYSPSRDYSRWANTHEFADRYGFDGLCRAVEESGIRGCLGKIVMDSGKYAGDPKWAMHPGLIENREMSLLGALDMHKKWDKAANDRIRVWFGARTPGG
jgi:hypothetical protein